MWCSETFAANERPSPARLTPPSSTPLDLYRSFKAAADSGDTGDPKIVATREALMSGANSRLTQGVIDQAVKAEIEATLERLSANDFRPLLYLIPRSLVADRLERVPPQDRAHPLNEEFTVDLGADEFQIIEFYLCRTPLQSILSFSPQRRCRLQVG